MHTQTCVRALALAPARVGRGVLTIVSTTRVMMHGLPTMLHACEGGKEGGALGCPKAAGQHHGECAHHAKQAEHPLRGQGKLEGSLLAASCPLSLE